MGGFSTVGGEFLVSEAPVNVEFSIRYQNQGKVSVCARVAISHPEGDNTSISFGDLRL